MVKVGQWWSRMVNDGEWWLICLLILASSGLEPSTMTWVIAMIMIASMIWNPWWVIEMRVATHSGTIEVTPRMYFASKIGQVLQTKVAMDPQRLIITAVLWGMNGSLSLSLTLFLETKLCSKGNWLQFVWNQWQPCSQLCSPCPVPYLQEKSCSSTVNL